MCQEAVDQVNWKSFSLVLDSYKIIQAQGLFRFFCQNYELVKEIQIQ